MFFEFELQRNFYEYLNPNCGFLPSSFELFFYAALTSLRVQTHTRNKQFAKKIPPDKCGN